MCGLARVASVAARMGPSHMVTLLEEARQVETPTGIEPGRHLRLAVDDVDAAIEGFRVPAEEHIVHLLRFAEAWDGAAPMLIHCHAGFSRSPAAALVVQCALAPDVPEIHIARALRRAAPWVMPNRLIVALADEVLGRGGRLIAALEACGDPVPGATGHPFRLAPPFAD